MGKHKHNHKNSRRQFLGTMGCAGLGLTSFLSSVTNLGLLNAAAASNMPIYSPQISSGYKALVCLSMDGGNDSFNMLVPRGTSEYNEYAAIRSNQALAQNTLLPITHNTPDGKQYGLHPNLSNIKNMFDSGNAAFVANVGTMISPTTMSDYNNGTNLPLGLFSHIDQLQHWQTSIPQSRSNVGWGGRLADILYSQNTNTNISMNISLDGINIFQNGNTVTEYSIQSTGQGSVSIEGYDQNDAFNIIKRQTLDNLLDQSYQDVLKTAYADAITNSQSNALQFGAAINGVSPFTTTFQGTDFSNKLEMVAKTIAARNTLGFSRQVFYVNIGGFDNHDEVIINHGNLMNQIDAAVGSFWGVMQELGLTDDVTMFTISEFGRTLTSNGNGTDHGWGGNCMVIGGGVNGQDIYGQYPDLYLNNPLDTGEGRLIPTTSCDEYFAELALWFADNGTSTLSTTQLSDIFPNIGNFWTPTPGQKPIGFMS